MEDAELWVDLPAFSGGCQCGAVRYDVAPGKGFASICHCRMCQRAVGGPFEAFLKVAAANLTWHGTPALFASSNIAERGFCRDCGTPLFYRRLDADTIEVTSGTLPPQIPFRPVRQWGLEGRQPWLDDLTFPGADTVETGIVSGQSAEGAI